MKRWIVVGVIVIILVAAVGVLMTKREPASEQGSIQAVEEAVREVRRQAVSVEPATYQTMQERLALHGIISPWAEVNIVPKVPGRVAKVLAKVGQEVAAGDILVQLETEELDLQVKQAEAALASARAALGRMQAGARPEEIEQAGATLEQAKAGYENARLTHERAAKLHEAGVMAGKDWDAIKAQYEVAKAQKLAAEKTLELVKKGARDEDLDTAKAGVAQAEAALALARLSREHAAIKAPIAGVVNQVNVQVGDMAGGGLPVVNIVDISRVKLNLQVSEREVIRLSQGQEVTVALDVQPDVLVQGQVSSIAPAADSRTGLFAATVDLTNPEGNLKPGMYGTAHVVVKETTDVLSIPERAVFTAEGRPAVYVVRDEVAYTAPVELGIKSDGFVEVRSGLKVGDEVIVRGREFVTDKAPVRVVERGIMQ
ncbi:MAG: efflux RND transporter periplasmic adaptor subunit [Firmicutes bacterium]|nr:efflux RND transporter periplasmic adaptor subunit [Bacillota bacterium]